MSEYETNPQRHEAPNTEEPSHRPADTSRDSAGPERGQSDTTTQFASSAPASSASPAPAPTSAAPASGASVSGGAGPDTTAQQPVVGQPGGYPASPWQGGQSQQAGQPAHPGQPGYGVQHPGYGGQSAYPGQQPGQSPYAAPSTYPGQPLSGQPNLGQPQPGQPAFAGQTAHGAWTGGPGAPGQPEGQSLPPWAQPVGGDQQRDSQPGRGRRLFVTGAAAVLLALAAGGVGAYTALAFDQDSAATTTQAGSSPVTRVVDRSSLAQIATAVQDSVVSINTGSGEGSGVVLTADGFVLTNNHVVASAAAGGTVKVVFADGKTADATIVGTDERTDLAVVKAAGVSGLKPATFGKSADMQVGDTVLALGSPLGLEGSVTAGIISAKDRTIKAGSESEPDQQNPFGQQQEQPQGSASMSGLLQTDAPINPGNSGGALVNTNGQVIGINTAIYSSGQGSGNIGLGFAIPSDKASLVANALMKGEKISHPALGVSVAEVEGGGAGVKTVTPNSAAAKAGLQQGDVITKVDDKAINDSDDLVAVVQAGTVGESVTITFTRNGAQQTVTATLSEAS